MRGLGGLGLVLLLAGGVAAASLRMVVADLPYARVLDAATAALADYPEVRAADGRFETGWRERAARPDEMGFERVQERATVRVEPFGERITRVTVDVEVQGWRDGRWVPIRDTEPAEQALLDRIRDAQSPRS